MARKRVPPITLTQALHRIIRDPKRSRFRRAVAVYAVQMAIQEAFMTGRVYAAGGEKESPADIQHKLLLNTSGAFVQAMREQWK